MANAYYGHEIVGELADALSFPTDGSPDNCTQMVYVGNETNGGLWMYVYCNAAIAVASGEEFNIQFVSYSSDTIGSATSPFSNTNNGARPGSTGTADFSMTANEQWGTRVHKELQHSLLVILYSNSVFPILCCVY